MANNDEKLTTLQDSFVMAYTSFGMKTYKNSFLSIIAAGSKAKTDRALTVVASRLLTNVDVRAKIDAIESARAAQLAVKTGYTVEKAQQEYEEARLLAMHVNQPAAAASATTGKARLYGFDKDNAIGEKTVIIIGPRVAESPIKQVESEVLDADGQG